MSEDAHDSGGVGNQAGQQKCTICDQLGLDPADVHPPRKPNAFQRLWAKIANSKAVEHVGEAIGEAADKR